MKALPNGPVVFNATPHSIRFAGGITVEPDEVISASISESEVKRSEGITFVETVFSPTDEGEDIVARAQAMGADVIVGSIITAQAYPGRVVAMTPAPGYERVPTAEKRMNPDKFTVFSEAVSLSKEDADKLYGIAHGGAICPADVEFISRVLGD